MILKDCFSYECSCQCFAIRFDTSHGFRDKVDQRDPKATHALNDKYCILNLIWMAFFINFSDKILSVICQQICCSSNLFSKISGAKRDKHPEISIYLFIRPDFSKLQFNINTLCENEKRKFSKI